MKFENGSRENLIGDVESVLFHARPTGSYQQLQSSGTNLVEGIPTEGPTSTTR